MRQHLDTIKAEAAEQKPPEPMITDECHQEALAATWAPMYTSKTSYITVALIPDVEFIDAAKYDHSWGLNKTRERRPPLRLQVLWLRLHKIQLPLRLHPLLPKLRQVQGMPGLHLIPHISVRHWDR